MYTSAIRQQSDAEEDEIEDQNWDDWEADDDCTMEEQSFNSQLRCLFCDSGYNSPSALFKHCDSVHHFDFQEIRKAYSLDFYKCFKLINYIRSQVAANKCWSWGNVCCSDEQLRSHLHESVSFENNILPWDDDKYLKPFLQDDALLYSFDEDDEYEKEDDTFTIDSKELATHLSQFEHIKDNEGCAGTFASEYISRVDDDVKEDRFASESMSSCNNGAKEIHNFDKDTNNANHLEGSVANDATNVSDGTLALKNTQNKSCSISYIRNSAAAIKNTDKNYFGSYSSFGIHRDMISDKVRTDAYREAILDNPSLLRGAVVMDVGCGTGILSLFAAKAEASSVIAVEASDKMAAVATQIAKDNGLLRNGTVGEGGKGNGVIQVVKGMIEEIGATDHIQPCSIDVLVSEWMGYCLLYESMLSSVLFARDRWLKPGGAILPDTATMFVAGFGRGATSSPFWENVYGFDMSCIGREVDEGASKAPIVDVIDSCNIVTNTEILQSFDLATMQPKQMEFTAEIELETKPLKNPSDSKLEVDRCYGVVLWFDTGFSERFCKEKPVMLSTSPNGPSTHWSQTILTFRKPIAMAPNFDGEKSGEVGTDDSPAVRIKSRISIARAVQHRSIDISLELTAIGPDGLKRNWPAQIFNLN